MQSSRGLYPLFRTLALHPRLDSSTESTCVDLTFSRFEADGTVVALPPDLAVLMVGVAARQAASPTAMIQARLPAPHSIPDWFLPAHGAFNLAVAQLLAPPAHKESEK